MDDNSKPFEAVISPELKKMVPVDLQDVLIYWLIEFRSLKHLFTTQEMVNLNGLISRLLEILQSLISQYGSHQQIPGELICLINQFIRELKLILKKYELLKILQSRVEKQKLVSGSRNTLL